MKKALFWFRRDLRLEDNCGLFYCLTQNDQIAPIFIFDKKKLSHLPMQDRGVEFVWNSVMSIKETLHKEGSDILIHYDNWESIVELAIKYKVNRVYCNHSYEPDMIELDDFVSMELERHGISFFSYKDSVIFEKDELMDIDNKALTEFEDYKKIWKKNINASCYQDYPSENFLSKMVKYQARNYYSLEDLGFERSEKTLGGSAQAYELFEKFKDHVLPFYRQEGIGTPSYLSAHNRYGTISPRYLVRESIKILKNSTGINKLSCETWIEQLIKRDFYFQLLFHYPNLADEARDETIAWENNMYHFQLWCEAKTGYPIIDAAMTQLNTTGYLAETLRRLLASFLTKIMHVDYRFGEAYFATKLIDYDVALNNAGWQESYQYCPNIQQESKRIDKEAKYIHKFLPFLSQVPAEYLHEPWRFEEEILCYGIDIGKTYPSAIMNPS